LGGLRKIDFVFGIRSSSTIAAANAAAAIVVMS
jgi:hypothetical protein